MENLHDPINRLAENEPYFLLSARDPTAAEMVTLWAVLRKRDGSLVDAVVKRLKILMMDLPVQPHKDNEHFWSAQKVATDMLVWQKDQEQRARIGIVGTEAV